MAKTIRKFEIALLYDSYDYNDAYIETIEFELTETEQVKKYILDTLKEESESLYKIEVSILEQDEDGANNETYTFCDIDYLQLKNKLEEAKK